MKKVYICSPYRAKNSAELDRNIDYAQELTRKALTAGLELLKGCDFVVVGMKYGVSEGMNREIHTAAALGIPVIDAEQLALKLKYEERRIEEMANDYAKLHCCHFCKGSRLHTCTGYDCREPYQRAYEHAKELFKNG